MGPQCNQVSICSRILREDPEQVICEKLRIDYFQSTYLTYGISSTWISKTIILIRNALNSGVADVIRRTSALLLMSDALAFSFDTAGVGKQAGVGAGIILAAFGSLTVLVTHTFR